MSRNPYDVSALSTAQRSAVGVLQESGVVSLGIGNNILITYLLRVHLIGKPAPVVDQGLTRSAT
jgi:hypothetical protein